MIFHYLLSVLLSFCSSYVEGFNFQKLSPSSLERSKIKEGINEISDEKGILHNAIGTLNNINEDNIFVRVGSSDTFRCGILPKSVSSQLQGVWNAEMINGEMDLLSFKRINNTEIVIQPPIGASIYYKTGWTEILCSFNELQSNKVIFSFKRLIKVVGCPTFGTLNGVDTGEVILPFGSNKKLRCAIKPDNIESILKGYWLAKQVGGEKDLLSIKLLNNTISIEPPVNNGSYETPGVTEIQCIYKSRQNTTLYSFKRTVRIEEMEQKYPGYWIGRILSNKDNIIEMNTTANETVVFQPPKPYKTYTNRGKAQVECIYKLYKNNKVLVRFINTIIVYTNQVSYYLDIHSDYIYRIHIGSNRRVCCTSYEKTEQSPYTWKISVPNNVEGKLVSYNGTNCIQPRKGDLIYLTPGTFNVTCDLKTKSGGSTGISKTKTVHLVDLGRIGTINGHNGDNGYAILGTSKIFQCGIIPKSVESKLNGYWKAVILDQYNQPFSLNLSQGKVIIGPYNGKIYEKIGYIQIQCQYTYKYYEVEFAFDKYIYVTSAFHCNTRSKQNPVNLTYSIGSANQFACCYTPKSINSDGYCKLLLSGSKKKEEVYPEDELSIEYCDDDYIFGPPNNKHVYTDEKQWSIQCSYLKKNYNTEYDTLKTHMKVVNDVKLYFTYHVDKFHFNNDNDSDSDDDDDDGDDDEQINIGCIVERDPLALVHSKGIHKITMHGYAAQYFEINYSGKYPVIKSRRLPTNDDSESVYGYALFQCSYTFYNGEKYTTDMAIYIVDKKASTYEPPSVLIITILSSLMSIWWFVWWIIVLYTMCWIVFYQIYTTNEELSDSQIEVQMFLDNCYAIQNIDHQHPHHQIVVSTNQVQQLSHDPSHDFVELFILNRDEIDSELFTQIKGFIQMYQSYYLMVNHWKSLWLANDREGIEESAQMIAAFIRKYMKDNSESQQVNDDSSLPQFNQPSELIQIYSTSMQEVQPFDYICDELLLVYI
ncbi:unnamed protein product [Trichobilharzia szidati]|nr:unnamed protein product [Trichobilharzia szidati]